MSKLSIHDNFIRSIMADKKIAKDYFQGFLPIHISTLLDFETLEQSPDSYVSAELRKTISDIVFTCGIKDSSGMVKICLLIEHKSYIDDNVAVQLGSYIFSGLTKQVRNGDNLSMIIPILIYHGKRRWQYQTLRNLFENLAHPLQMYLPHFDYIYNDLGDISDEQIELLENKFLVASILALKHSFDKKWLELNAVRLLILSEGIEGNLQSGFIVYLFGRSGLDENEIVDILEEVPFNMKDKVMSTLDIFIEKGRKLGLEEGLEKGKIEFVTNLLKNTDINPSKIASLANVSEEFVKNIQSDLH